MPNLLAPTVAERLAKCCEQVFVFGVMPGAEVTLRVEGTDYTETVPGRGHTFDLPRPLEAGQRVSAQQRLGADESEWSPEVVVEEVYLPPNPSLSEPSIPRCGTCVLAWGVAPGSRLILESGGGVIADGQANRYGERCLKLDDYPRGSTGVFSSTETCETPSASRFHIDVHQEPNVLPTPLIPEPVFGCQTRVGLSGLVPGSLVQITVTDSDGTDRNYYLRTCWSNVNANLGDELAVGDRITARQSMAEHDWDCNSQSGPSAPVQAATPDERIKPVIMQPIYEGDRVIQVTNQIEGGLITVYSRDDENDTEEEDLGSRSSSQFPEVPVSALRARQILRAAQELCEVIEYSDPVTVQPLPADLEAPRVPPPLYACASVVMVENVLPGAMVYLVQSEPHDTEPEYPIGQDWASGPSQAVWVYPVLTADSYVRAYQVVGGRTSPFSDRVPVDRMEGIPAPTVGDPVLAGSRSVWVRDIIPGAYVRVFDDGQQIGGSSVGMAQAWIPLWRPVTENSIITARQMLCLDESAESAPVPATPGTCHGPPPYEPEAWNDGDWSSDVCSSDLLRPAGARLHRCRVPWRQLRRCHRRRFGRRFAALH